MDDSSTQTTLNIPSILAFAVISFFAIRYFFFSPSSSQSSFLINYSFRGGTASRSSAQALTGRGARRNFPAERVDFITSMFPQLSRRDVEWDLVRNGGSLQATSDRVLRDGRLPAAPPNFQPIYATPTSQPAQRTSTSRPGQAPSKQTYSDLITRYNLTSRIAALTSSTPSSTSNIIGKSASTEPTTATDPEPDSGSAIQSREEQKAKGGWSANKDERQALLRRRREDMILAARQKLEERDRKGKAKEESS